MRGCAAASPAAATTPKRCLSMYINRLPGGEKLAEWRAPTLRAVPPSIDMTHTSRPLAPSGELFTLAGRSSSSDSPRVKAHCFPSGDHASPSISKPSSCVNGVICRALPVESGAHIFRTPFVSNTHATDLPAGPTVRSLGYGACMTSLIENEEEWADAGCADTSNARAIPAMRHPGARLRSVLVIFVWPCPVGRDSFAQHNGFLGARARGLFRPDVRASIP